MPIDSLMHREPVDLQLYPQEELVHEVPLHRIREAEIADSHEVQFLQQEQAAEVPQELAAYRLIETLRVDLHLALEPVDLLPLEVLHTQEVQVAEVVVLLEVLVVVDLVLQEAVVL